MKMLSKGLFLASLLVFETNPLSWAQQAAPQPAQEPAAQPAPAPATTPQPAAAAPASAPAASTAPATVNLQEGSDVSLSFNQDLSSKTATEGDTIEFVLAEDLKVGNVVVAKAGCEAVGEVSHAEKSGMMGKAGSLDIRLNYLKVGSVRVHLRGTKGKEGQSGTGSAVALTVLFGPIGLIKHGKNVEIKKGTALKVFVADDVNLPPTA
jgi:hypothetical protein